jgi:hypothetical protein
MTNGIEVYEAWWLQTVQPNGLVPTNSVPVWKSQYQRETALWMNFTKLQKLYYVTDTYYHDPQEIRRLAPSALLIRRFRKRSSNEFIDVYRLNLMSR